MASAVLNESQLERERLIGRGLTSEVFSWGEERVLKLNLPWVPAATTQREFAVARAVHAAGVNVPAVFELVQVGGRHGIVFERVNGPSMVSEVEKRPWRLFGAARQLAELHARLHEFEAPPDLPSQREQIESWVDRAPDFSAAEKEVAHRNLGRLPAGKCICHGDFHPANIILSALGPVIIDWSRGTRGHALADVARTSVLFESAPLPPETSLRIRVLMKLSRRLLHAAYLRRYLQLRPATMEELEIWRVPQRMAKWAWLAEQKAALAREREPWKHVVKEKHW